MERMIELFAILGFPARILGRLPLITRYVFGGFSSHWQHHTYAVDRFGEHYRWKLWLLLDIEELAMIEHLINHGPDGAVVAYKNNQLEAFRMVAIIGALVAGVASTTMQVPGVSEASYVCRGCFIVTLILSLLATFFTCVQQRTYGFLEDPAAIRAWLSNGMRYLDKHGREILQSSTVSHQLLQVPFELLCISITAYLGGLGVYLGSALTLSLHLGGGFSDEVGNKGVFITYLATCSFTLCLLGQLLGGRDVENKRCAKVGDSFGTGRDYPVPVEAWSRPCVKEGTNTLSGGRDMAFSNCRAENGVAVSGAELASLEMSGLLEALFKAAVAYRSSAAVDEMRRREAAHQW